MFYDWGCVENSIKNEWCQGQLGSTIFVTLTKCPNFGDLSKV